MSLFDKILTEAAKTSNNNALSGRTIPSPYAKSTITNAADTNAEYSRNTHDVDDSRDFSPNWTPSEDGLYRRAIVDALINSGLRGMGVSLDDVLAVKNLHETKKLPAALYEAATFLNNNVNKKISNINGWIKWFLTSDIKSKATSSAHTEKDKTQKSSKAPPSSYVPYNDYKQESAKVSRSSEAYDYMNPYGGYLNEEEKSKMDKHLGALPENLHSKIIELFANKNWGVAWMHIYRYQMQGYDCDTLFKHYHQYYNALELNKIV